MNSKKYKIENIEILETPTNKQFVDRTGDTYGKLKVLGYAGKYNKNQYWWCECSCINKYIVKVQAGSLKSGDTTSCGCFQKEIVYKTKFNNLVGKKFNNLLVLEEIKIRSKYGVLFLCQCDCGRIVEILSANLISKNSTQCKKCASLQVGEKRKTHGMSNSEEYSSYNKAKDRCTNLNNSAFHHYGGRRIEFRFNSFEEFYTELGNKPEPKGLYSIERINNEGHYEKGNLKWGNNFEQARNKRNNHLITINNQEKCMSEWAEIYNISVGTVFTRIEELGWCNECSISIKPWEGTCEHKYFRGLD